MTPETAQDRVIRDRQVNLIDRREAIRRVTAMLGGFALVGGNALLTGCRDEKSEEGVSSAAQFSAQDIAFLDEVADTMLPQTRTPGAKAAQVGAFMALMVQDTYDERDQKTFREGMQKLDETSQRMHNVGFMQATPQQRLALLERLDREQFEYMRRREAAGKPRGSEENGDTTEGSAYVPDQRQEGSIGTGDANAAPAITADAPAHYFRMMKELALLGYFTSEIGYNQAQRYAETPGRFDPCVPYTPGEKAWAPHA